MSNADTIEHLRALVDALDNAFISVWQSTAAWQKELDAAREYLAALSSPAAIREPKP